MSPANHYVDNEKLYAAMIEHITKYREAVETGSELPKISNYIGKCIKQIAERLSLTKSFAGYSFREDMIQDGIETCLKYLHNFNPEKYKKPFNYFTQIIYYAFLYRIDKEKKETYIKYKVMENSHVMNSLVDMPAEDASHFQATIDTIDVDKIAALVDRYETQPRLKREKAQADKLVGVEKFTEDDNNE